MPAGSWILGSLPGTRNLDDFSYLVAKKSVHEATDFLPQNPATIRHDFLNPLSNVHRVPFYKATLGFVKPKTDTQAFPNTVKCRSEQLTELSRQRTAYFTTLNSMYK